MGSKQRNGGRLTALLWLGLGLVFGFIVGKVFDSPPPRPIVTLVAIGFFAAWFVALSKLSSPMARFLQFCTGWGIGAMVVVAFY